MAILTYAQFIAVYPSTGASQSLIEALIAVAQAELERFCGRQFETGTYTQVDSGKDQNGITLNNIPITSVTSVSLIADDGTASVIDSTAYRTDLETGRVQFIDGRVGRFLYDDYGVRRQPQWGFANSLPDRFRNVSTVYVGGYATIPADIQQLIRDMVDAMIANGAGGAGTNFSVTSETLGSYSYTRGNASNPNQWWQTRAAMYRRLYV